MNLNKKNVDEIFNIIENSNEICIAGHKAPDGDCIGSVMALYELLKVMNKNITVCIDGLIPFNYKPFVNENIILKNYDGQKFDVVIVLDCSDRDRLGKFKDVLNNTNKTICIDHHKTNSKFADVNIIEPEMSSTGELLYDVIKAANKAFTKEIAELLYVAIITDTGKFSYSNTSSATHIKTAHLMDLGINVSQIDNILFNSKPANVVKAFIDCIKNIELFYNNKLGITSITDKILQDNNVDMGDIDGVVEFIREIKEVEVSCVLKENSDGTKVSLRAKSDDIDVSKIALIYGGGGHKKAAGFEVNDTVEKTKNIIINELNKYLAE